MSNATITSEPNIPRPLFAALWIAWAVALVGGLLYGMAAGHGQFLAAWGRMTSSLVLTAAGFLAWWTARRSLAAGFCCGVAWGMALGTLGDFSNAGLLSKIVPIENHIMGGIVAFGLGHIAYISGAVNIARKLALTRGNVWVASVLAWQVVGVVAWWFAAYQGTDAGARRLVWPALPYTLLLAGTAGVSTALAVQDRRFALFAVGAALFLISDLILAVELFHGDFKHDTVAVWSAYGAGQMLIVFSTLDAMRAVGNPRAAAA